MITNRYKKILLGVVSVAAICWLAGQFDYSRSIAGKTPLFARWEMSMNDGGSIWYIGPGYTVFKLHELRLGIDPHPDDTTNATYVPFRVGVLLEYWTPFVSREQTKFILVTNK
jgi:hypothetical protein